MSWSDYDRRGNPNASNYDPLRFGVEYGFNLEAKAGEIVIASSDGNDQGVIYPEMFDRFQVTIDQLEGEINLPYEFIRELKTIQIFENTVLIPIQVIRVPRSQLGGFAQFRINYQYVDQVTEEVYSGEVITERVLVPRRPFIPPPPPPPVFTIDENQIKEALADKIYEKFFSDPNIDVGNLNIQSLQTTTSDDGVGYKTGRTSEDDPLVFFKKDRNTPENARDFYNDETDDNPINQISLYLSSSFAGTDANGIIDLSDKLDNELSITSVVSPTRIPSVSLDPPEFIPGTTAPLYYLETTSFRIEYSRDQQGPIIVPFGELYKFYEQPTGDLKQRDDEWANKINLSQLTTPKVGTKIDVNKAKNVLDTNIFELLPNQSKRQNEINEFFQKFQALIGPKPNFQDVDGDGAGEQIDDLQLQSRISTANEKETSFITRLNSEADDVNQNKTLESMRNELNEYLGDVDNVIEEFGGLTRYENKSEGFLKIRKPNQAIIIRNATDTLAIEETANINIDGVDYSGPSWAINGFTVTMWVRFLTNTAAGSLMTFGNPMLKTLPGFRLDTHTRSDFYPTTQTTQNRRMVRLVVYENFINPNGAIYDSHFGNQYSGNYVDRGVKYRTWAPENMIPVYEKFAADQQSGSWHVFFQHTQIPTDDLNEWFFICATYDPTIDEEGSFDDEDFFRDKDFWLNKKETDGTVVANSGFGNKCKVEIISKSDLLRARGFEV